MAGKKGRSGRPPADYKPIEPQKIETTGDQDPLDFLLTVMNDNSVDLQTRVRAGITAAQYKHKKRSDGGKKEDTERAAKSAGAGKYAPAKAPKLVVNNR